MAIKDAYANTHTHGMGLACHNIIKGLKNSGPHNGGGHRKKILGRAREPIPFCSVAYFKVYVALRRSGGENYYIWYASNSEIVDSAFYMSSWRNRCAPSLAGNPALLAALLLISAHHTSKHY